MTPDWRAVAPGIYEVTTQRGVVVVARDRRPDSPTSGWRLQWPDADPGEPEGWAPTLREVETAIDVWAGVLRRGSREWRQRIAEDAEARARRRRPRARPRVTGDCAWCGAELAASRVIGAPFPNRRGEVFCSRSHRQDSAEALRRLVERVEG